MKRCLKLTALSVVLSIMVLAATSCAVSDTGNTNAAATNGNTNAPLTATNGNANMTTSPVGGGALAEAITAREREMWDSLKNKDHDAFAKMLSSDSIYVSTDGVCDKPCSVNGVKDFAPTETTLSDIKTLTLDEDAAIITYTLNVKGTGGGQPIPPGAMRVSTAWVKRGTEWLAVFHQDSPVAEPVAAPTLAAETSKPASSAANANTNSTTAATTPAGGAAEDPVAKEKQVWDALKRKDWATFAASLAEDQIEVEPGGVHDKAGSIAGVKNFDFTANTTSEFKATELDKDATLVTYRVKSPKGPNGKPHDERASTIWVNRGGKWLAVFHQGTPVMPMPAK